jgi:hypothetical protein
VDVHCRDRLSAANMVLVEIFVYLKVLVLHTDATDIQSVLSFCTYRDDPTVRVN